MGRVEQALPVKQLCSRQGFSEANYYLWRSKYGGARTVGPPPPCVISKAQRR